jgi:hypothetical protein
MKIKVELASSDEIEKSEFADGVWAITPAFYAGGREAVVLRVSSLTEAGVVLGVSILRVSARDGKLRLLDRTKRVRSTVDQPAAKEKKET